jgi:hypothetical protein
MNCGGRSTPACVGTACVNNNPNAAMSVRAANSAPRPKATANAFYLIRGCGFMSVRTVCLRRVRNSRRCDTKGTPDRRSLVMVIGTAQAIRSSATG